MRILYLTGLYHPWVGGIEVFLRSLVQEVAGRGATVAIVTSGGAETTAGADEVDGTPVLRVPFHQALGGRDPGHALRLQRDLAAWIEAFDPDIVHSHDVGPLLWAYGRATRRRPRPLIVTVHTVMTEHVEGALGEIGRTLEAADRVTAVSQAAAADVRRLAPGLGDRLSVVPNGALPPTTAAAPVPAGAPRVVLCLGRLVELKGFDTGIDAFARVAAEDPTVGLVIAGDGPERAALQQRAEALGIADRVEFLGFVDRDEVGRLFTAAAVLLMPSRFEGLPLVALEAAWAARPVVGCRAPGLEEVVVDGETGFLVPPGDVAALAEAVARVFAEPARAAALGTAARARAEREYSLAASADAYLALYEELHHIGGR